MAVTELLLSGLNLMLLGMGIVFSFLTVLVLAMSGMSWLAQRLEVTESVTAPTSSRADSGSDELVAVVTAAINRYRAK